MPSPGVSIHWEENERQLVLIGTDIRCPRPKMGGRNVGPACPQSAAESAWSEDLGMLTSYLQLSGAGLNSLPLAVTFPTLTSACCSGSALSLMNY